MSVKIPKMKIIENDLVIFDKPKKVYIPLISGNDKDITILVKKGEYVFKGSIVAKRKGNLRIPIHSSVSGTVIDFVEKTSFDGEKVKCILIENDFEEDSRYEKFNKKEINKYTKEEFINNIKENGIVGLGGAGFPTYIKYDTNKKIKTLIINAVECEPYIMADYYIAKQKCEEILEAIDAILEINKIDEAIIAIKKDNYELKEAFDNFIGTYLKIKLKLVPNVYPMGWERKLIYEVTGKQYNKLPIEKGIIVNNISTIYAIYESLKFNKPLMEKVVTFSGEKLKKRCNVLVKIGTPIKDILDYLEVEDKNIVISGGPMMGDIIDDDAVICNNQSCVLVLEKKLNLADRCLKCGKCISVCPAKLTPVMIMNSKCKNEKDKEKLKKLHPERCIECGLCSYICPSKINVREIVKKKKEVLKGDK